MSRTHPNVLKAQRQRRKGRRAYLTSVYSLIKVPRRISTSHIPEDAKDVFNYRQRGKGYYDPYLNALFPGVKQESQERKFALERSEEEKLLELIEDPDVCDYITLPSSPKLQKRITFVFNRKYSRCFFVEVWYAENNSFVLKSKVYGSKERAMFDHDNKRINWHSRLDLASLSLVLPRRG
jgi:hypothetical protein